MKDPLKIVKDCRASENQEPVFVLRGQDRFADQILEQYLLHCMANQCNSEFIDDLVLLINDFVQFQKEEQTKIPD